MHPEKVALTALFLSVILFFFSLALFPLSVHTYCSKRPVAAAQMMLQAALAAWAFARKKTTRNDRGLSLGIAVFAIFGLALNAAFIVYATNLCHAIKE